MADYHILPNHRLAIHTPTPAGAVNEIGKSYRELFAVEGRGSSLRDAADDANPEGWEITAAEKAKIAAGELVETIRHKNLSAMPGTNGEKRAEVLRLIGTWEPEILKKAAAAYAYVGHSGSTS